MTDLTAAQSRASRPDASAWVEANAGTGKTHILSTRVLRLLLDGTAPDKILCLTYTRAAAAEMANRIQKRLGSWVLLDDPALTAALVELGIIRPGPETLARARTLFAEILELPHGIPIQTIHAFCQSLLGRFPVESGLAPGFALLDDADTALLLGAARDRVLGEARDQRHGPVIGALRLLAGLISEQQFGELVKALIAERHLLAAISRHHGLGVGRALNQALDLTPNDSPDLVLETAFPRSGFDPEPWRRVMAALLQGTAANRARAATLGDWLAADSARKIADFERLRGVFLTQRNEPAKWVTQAMRKADPDIDDRVGQCQDWLVGVCDQLSRAMLAERSHALLNLGFALAQSFADAKAREAKLDYDDLIAGAETLLHQSGMAGWVLYKLDGGIDHVLLDEAQDTSPAQWRIIDQLIGEFFSGENAGNPDRSLFVVGDPKQSIFGFQGAAPELFADYRGRYAKKADGAAKRFLVETLDLSFRSTAPVLGLIDRVFPTTHHPHRHGHAGLVVLWPTEKPARGAAASENWAMPLHPEATSAASARLADRIADRIALWLATGEVLPARGRAIAPGDILILVRRRNAFSNQMIRALKKRGVPVAGIDRLNITAPIAVMDLLALGRFALLPEDDLNLAALLKSPLVGLDEDQLFRLCYNRGRQSLWARLGELAATDAAIAAARGLLADILAGADHATPYEFYARALLANQGRARLIARLGAEIEDPIDEFLARTLGYEASHIPSLQGFIAWMEQHGGEVKRDPEHAAPQVRLMTVHGAKGLQAPIVILADTCAGPRIKTQLLETAGKQRPLAFWYRNQADRVGALATAYAGLEAREQAEYRRLLYVALSRAEDRLYVTGYETQTGRATDCWYDQIAKGMGELVGHAIDPDALEEEIIHQCPQTAAPVIDHQALAAAALPPLPGWARIAPKAEARPARPLAPSRFDEPVPAAASPGRHAHAARRRGSLIHKLLQYLPDLPVERRGDAARRYLERNAVANTEIDDILTTLDRLFAQPLMATLTGPGSRAEVPVAALLGEVAVSGTIDRLVIGETEIIVADYKTNRSPPARIEDIPTAYVGQMAAYRAALAKIWPDRKIRCLLVWTDGPMISELPLSALDERTKSILATAAP